MVVAETMVETETEVLDVIRSKINDVPKDKLVILRNYIDYLTGETDIDETDDTEIEETPGGYPLDDFDYEMARRVDERTDMEFISFDEALKEAGLTYADIQK